MVYTRKTWADGSGGGTPITAAELNRMESGFGLDPRWVAPGTATVVDEFNTGSLAAAWTRVDGVAGGSSRATWAVGADVLSVSNSGGDANAEWHAMVQPLSGAGGSISVGDAFTTCVDILSNVVGANNNSCAGIILADGNTAGAGKQVQGILYQGSATVQREGVFYGTNYSTNTAFTGNIVVAFRKVYLRLVYTAANTFRIDQSPDGVSWMTGVASQVVTAATYTHVGLVCSSYGNASPFIASFEYLRRYSGVS